jgi:hypothetical protein
MSWRLMGNLASIRAEIRYHFDPPPRMYTIGDKAHMKRVSDHNVANYGFGDVVAALDVMLPAGPKASALVRACVGRKDLAYVIHDGKIWSARYGWSMRPYTGTNKHRDHVHISSRHSRAADADRTPLHWR